VSFLDSQYKMQFHNKFKKNPISPIFKGKNFININLFCKARLKLTKSMALFNSKSLPTYYKVNLIHQNPREISMK